MTAPLTSSEREMLREVHRPNVRTDKLGNRTVDPDGCPFEHEWPCFTVRLLNQTEPAAPSSEAALPEAGEGPLDALVAAARPGGTVMLARYGGRPADLLWEAVTEASDGLCVGSGPTIEAAVAVALAKANR